MSRGNLLYDRPDLTQRFGKLALYVTGTLPSAQVDVAYEGRLQIRNAIGDCWAELINGTLPPGASVTVDNATHEVVVRWPAYSEAAVLIANADFELDDTSWLKGYGWTIENKGARPGDTSGAKAAAFRGSGEAFIEAATFYPLTGVQQSINYGVTIQQGGSSSGNVRAAAALRYYDASYKLIQTDKGNVVSSGSDGEWKGSGGTSAKPGAAAYVRPAVWGLRKRQNKPLYADDFTWNLSGVAVGAHNPASHPVTIRVHDAGGRIADWVGVVNVLPPAWYWPLFANGEQGMVFDYNDLGSLYQDTAHTVPVTAVGQTVSAVRCQVTGQYIILTSGTAVLGYDATHSKYFVTCGSSPNFSGTGVVPVGMLGGGDKSMVFVAELNAAEQGIPIRMGNQGVARDQFNMGNFIDSVNVFELWIGGGANGVTTGRQGGLAVYIGTLSGTVPKAYKNGNTLFNPAATISQPSNLSTRDILIGNSMVNRPLYSAVVLNRLLTASEIATVSATAL